MRLTLRAMSVGAVLMSWALQAVGADAVPAAIATDPVVDAAHPAHSTVLHIPTHGVLINGLLYAPSGVGPHPTLIICHGLPGNEKNLDLAQAVRRAGWNTVTFNYRGSWGSGGTFSFQNVLEDVEAVLAYLRQPQNSQALGIDTERLVLAGHSMGGWATALTAAHDTRLAGVILISAGDMGGMASSPGSSAEKLEAFMADDMESLAGTSAKRMAAEIRANARVFSIGNAAGGLTRFPLLALTSDDGLAPPVDALVRGVEAKGGTHVTEIHVATDHSWSDHRIALESIVITWLDGLGSH